jgi:hypothetical protein
LYGNISELGDVSEKPGKSYLFFLTALKQKTAGLQERGASRFFFLGGAGSTKEQGPWKRINRR